MHRTLPTCIALIALALTLVASAIEAQESDKLVSVWDGVYTGAQAERGKATFDVSCSRCHNTDLSGSERGPTLTGEKFMSNWRDGSLDALYGFIRDQMPEGSAKAKSYAITQPPAP